MNIPFGAHEAAGDREYRKELAEEILWIILHANMLGMEYQPPAGVGYQQRIANMIAAVKTSFAIADSFIAESKFQEKPEER